MKKLLIVLLVLITNFSVYSSGWGLKRKNCWGDLSYRYKNGGDIASLNWYSGDMSTDWSGTQRSCNLNNRLFNLLYNSWLNPIYNVWALSDSWSGPTATGGFSWVRYPGLMSAGQMPSLIDTIPNDSTLFEARSASEEANYAHSTISFSNDLYTLSTASVTDLNAHITLNSSSPYVKGVIQLVFFIMDDENDTIIDASDIYWEGRAELTNQGFYTFGGFTGNNFNISWANDSLRVDLITDSLGITLPASLSHDRIGIRVYSTITSIATPSESIQLLNNAVANGLIGMIENIYPNPVNTILTTEFYNYTDNNWTVRVYDNSNNLIDTYYVPDNVNSYSIDCTSFPAGTYILELEVNAILERKVFIKI